MNVVERARRWIAQDPDPDTRRELEALIAADDHAALEARFSGRLKFGTAGLRGLLGAGPARMNRVTVSRATAGFCAWLKKRVPEAASRGICIGRDARDKSDVFARDVIEKRPPVSALGMFEQGFYDRLGYGTSSPIPWIWFDPATVRVEEIASGGLAYEALIFLDGDGILQEFADRGPVLLEAGSYELVIEVESTDTTGGLGEIQGSFAAASFEIAGRIQTGCLADLGAPYGVLDLADVQAFVAEISIGGPGADLARPAGQLDLADIEAFISSFLSGCP